MELILSGTTRDLNWASHDVVLGIVQLQGYCPSADDVYRPCDSDEVCRLTNEELTCTPGRESIANEDLLAGFQCPTELPPPPPPQNNDTSLALVTSTDMVQIEHRQSRGFLQADSYIITPSAEYRYDSAWKIFSSFLSG